MIYKQISSKVLIGNVFDRFNIDYSGFISRVPNWVHSAMRSMNAYSALISKPVDGEVKDYKCEIPADTKLLDGISYLGLRLPRTNTINQKTNTDMSKLTHSYHSYELNNNGYIITTFEKCELGELVFYIKTLPMEYDSTTRLYFPLIPDNVALIEALEWYIIKRLLERGHKVRDYSLEKNNIYKNPAMAWDKYKAIAENSMARLDIDERQEISNLIRTFIPDLSMYGYGQFNNTNS